jgi:sugar phosphate isomerase/epimerase
MHERLSLHMACFQGASFADLAGYWRELGVHRVSLVSGVIEEEGVAAARAALDGRQVETITHLFMFDGRQLSPDEATWREPRAKLSRAIADASAVGARSIYMLTGGHGTLAWEEAADCFSRAIAPCVAEAEAAGVALLIEDAVPHYAHVHIAHSLRDTITLAQQAGIGVNLDIFSCFTEAGLKDTIARAMPLCRLVQVGDYTFGDPCLPGRTVPGDGDIPLPRILGWILEAGYRGVFDVELIGPRIEKEGGVSAARRAIDRVGEMLRTLGA